MAKNTSESSPLLNDSNGTAIQKYTNEHNDSMESTSVETTSKSISWTRQQKLVGVSIAFMNLAFALSFSVIAPFFPKEAERKGASASTVGFIFGLFELVIFLTAPIYGSILSSFGAKRMFLSGALLCGGCNILFGFLDDAPDGWVYVMMCFVCRGVEANGAAMGFTSSFAILAKTFPNNIATAMGTLETFSGIGMVLGPSLGGGLYSLGGFKLPFIVVGALVLSSALLVFFIMPEIPETAPLKGRFIDLLKIPGCIIIFVVTVACAMALSFLDPTFSPWMLTNFSQLTVGTVGLIFMVAPGSYGLSAPFLGWFSDKGYLTQMVAVGLLINGVAFLFIGPSSVLSFIPLSLVGVIIPLVFVGATVGMGLVPLFPLLLQHAGYYGHDTQSLQTFGLVSGLFTSGFSCGGFIGPSAAGYLSQQLGFSGSMTVCGFFIISTSFLWVGYVLIMKHRGVWPLPDNSPTQETTEETVEKGGVEQTS